MPTDVGSSCFTGQDLSEDTVRNTFVGRIKLMDQTQRLFPDIHFTCNSIITQWLIGGKGRNEDNEFLQLQLWQRTDRNTYSRRDFSTIRSFSTTTNNNVYAYFPEPPLEVKEGDILGVFQPNDRNSPLTIYYLENGGPANYGNPTESDQPYTSFPIDSALNQNDYPLITVVLGEFKNF